MSQFIILYSVIFLSFISIKSFALHTFQIEPGIIEMTSTNPYGFIITDIAEVKDHKTNEANIYFCLKEVKGKNSRCFYGKKADFKVLNKGFVLNGVQYVLKDRVSNKKVSTPIKSASYFYKLTIVRPQI